MKNLLKYILFTLTILFCATNINAQELIAEADSAYVNDEDDPPKEVMLLLEARQRNISVDF